MCPVSLLIAAVYFSGVLVSANIAATTMSQAIGAAVSSVRVANLLGSLAIMMFLLFGGFLLNHDQVPWYCTWIADLSYFNYAYEALAVRSLSLMLRHAVRYRAMLCHAANTATLAFAKLSLVFL